MQLNEQGKERRERELRTLHTTIHIPHSK